MSLKQLFIWRSVVRKPLAAAPGIDVLMFAPAILEIRPRRMHGADRIHRGKRRRATGLQRIVGVDGRGEPIVHASPNRPASSATAFVKKADFRVESL